MMIRDANRGLGSCRCASSPPPPSNPPSPFLLTPTHTNSEAEAANILNYRRYSLTYHHNNSVDNFPQVSKFMYGVLLP